MRGRLATMALAVTSLVVLAVLVPLAFAIRTIARDRAVRDGELQGQALIPVLATAADRRATADALDRVRALGRADVSVLLPDRSVIGSAFDLDLDLARRVATADTAITTRTATGVQVYTPVTNRDGERSVIAVRVPDADLTKGVARAIAVLVALALVLVGLAMFVADRLARSIVRPIAGLARTTERLQSGELDARAAASDGPPEVQAVARTINALAERIASFLQAERESVADLSHRLRTPIAGLRFEAESLGDPRESARIIAGVDDLTKAVDRLIGEARRVLPASRPFCDATEIVRERVAFWQPLADDEGRAVDVSVPEYPLRVAAAADDLGAVVDVLLENVFAHTSPGTSLSVQLLHRLDHAVLQLEDTGAGFADVVVLQRGMSSAGSTGLGLDIARKLAERAGGSFEIRNRPEGGASVTLALPTREMPTRETPTRETLAQEVIVTPTRPGEP